MYVKLCRIKTSIYRGKCRIKNFLPIHLIVEFSSWFAGSLRVQCFVFTLNLNSWILMWSWRNRMLGLQRFLLLLNAFAFIYVDFEICWHHFSIPLLCNSLKMLMAWKSSWLQNYAGTIIRILVFECRIGRFHNIYGPFGTWKGQPTLVNSVMTWYTLHGHGHTSAHIYLCILTYSLLHIVCPLFRRW